MKYVVRVEDDFDAHLHVDRVEQHARERKHENRGDLLFENVPVQIIGALEEQNRQEDLHQAVLVTLGCD